MQFDLFDSTQNKILGAANYADFKEALVASDCQKCPLSQSRTHIVVDRGNPDSGVLFIGEGPGENEDLQGKAFVGRAGKLLDAMLLQAGFDADRDGLIANVVKCRPPDNRQPTPKEAAACMPFLKKQIELMKPRFILLLGATALRYIVPEKGEFSMQKEAGSFFTSAEYPGVQMMVLYHPAYILRDGRKRPEMETHLKLFRARWAGG